MKVQNRYLVSNLDLYRYFKHKHNFNHKQYEDYMRTVLLNDQVILVDDSSINTFQFTRVIEECSEKERNLNEIIGKYFHKILSNYVVNEGVSELEKNCLIDALFRKKVVSLTDDESGYLLIPEWQFGHK